MICHVWYTVIKSDCEKTRKKLNSHSINYLLDVLILNFKEAEENVHDDQISE